MPDPVVVIEMLGPPRGKGRPRFRVIKTRATSFVNTYTDGETRVYEARLAQEARIAMLGKFLLDEPLCVQVEAFMPIPASFSKSKRAEAAAMLLVPVTKPDGDNLVKIALDSLNGIVWRDDSIIVRHVLQKLYSDRPRLMVSVWRWND